MTNADIDLKNTNVSVVLAYMLLVKLTMYGLCRVTLHHCTLPLAMVIMMQ